MRRHPSSKIDPKPRDFPWEGSASRRDSGLVFLEWSRNADMGTPVIMTFCDLSSDPHCINQGSLPGLTGCALHKRQNPRGQHSLEDKVTAAPGGLLEQKPCLLPSFKKLGSMTLPFLGESHDPSPWFPSETLLFSSGWFQKVLFLKVAATGDWKSG